MNPTINDFYSSLTVIKTTDNSKRIAEANNLTVIVNDIQERLNEGEISLELSQDIEEVRHRIRLLLVNVGSAGKHDEMRVK